MTKVSLRKLSILGLVLMAASAVTAAIVPSKAASKVEDANDGTLVASTNGALKTCVQDSENDFDYSCNRSVNATVSTNGADSFTGVPATNQTEENTSDSAAGPASSNAD